MNKQLQKVIDDLELLVREELIEHEDIRSFGIDPEDNYTINPRLVVQDAIKLLKEYDSALRGMVYQYCTVDKKFFEGENRVIRNPDQEVFFNGFMSAGEEAFRVLGIENGEEVTDEFVWG